ncbi:MAG: DUF790 family protein [Candidatus Bathyarchaeota archaeon]|nr:DUF790 family protein [Candidatus Bathyarchaeota archaeon]
MLPSELLIVKRRGSLIQPKLALLSQSNLEYASELISLYMAHVGKRRGELAEKLQEKELFKYKFTRGLSVLLDRNCVFTCKSPVPPQQLRLKLFTEAAAPVTCNAEREKIMRKTAAYFNIDRAMIPQLLYADLDENLLIQSFGPPDPASLLQNYNLSLTQTLLFNAVNLEITVSNNWQRLLYTAKKLGLIYEAAIDEQVKLKIDGPASVLKQTKRYGTALAKLVPEIIKAEKWTLHATILFHERKCRLELDSSLHSLYPNNPAAETFDSKIEEQFACLIRQAAPDWKIIREPTILKAGRSLLLPDFLLEKDNIQVYVEIVGFWTPDYIKRKIEKLNNTKTPMLILLNEKLSLGACTLENPHLTIIKYRNKLPAKQIIDHLKTLTSHLIEKQLTTLKHLNMQFTEPLVTFQSIAEQTGFSYEAIKEYFTLNKQENYITAQTCLIHVDVKEKLKNLIMAEKPKTFEEACIILKKEGISVEDAAVILKEIGCKITFHPQEWKTTLSF